MSKTSHKNRPIKDDKILVGHRHWNHFDPCLIRKLFLLFSGRLQTKLCCVDVQTITCSKTCRFQTHRVTTQIGFCIHHVYYLQGYSSSSSPSSSASFSHCIKASDCLTKTLSDSSACSFSSAHLIIASSLTTSSL